MRGKKPRVGTLALIAAATLVVAGSGCEPTPGQPNAITFIGCDRAYWEREAACWFTREPVGQGISADPIRVVFYLKTYRIEGIRVNGTPARAGAVDQIPGVAETVFALEDWNYDEVVEPGQVLHLRGRKVTLAFPSSPQPAEGAKYDVVVTYRGWILGDTAETAEVARTFRFTRFDPRSCTARPPTVAPKSGPVGSQVNVTWRADNCKQAALYERRGSTTSEFPVSPRPRLTGGPVPNALSDADALDAGAVSLSGSAVHELESGQTRFVLHAWAFDGAFSHAVSDAVTGTPATSPPASPPVQEYEYCLTNSAGNVHIWVQATSKEAAEQQLKSDWGGYTIKAGPCS